MRAPKQAFETQLVLLKQVRPEDAEFNLPKEIALDLNLMNHKLCQGSDLARNYIQNNIFLDSSTNHTYRLSPNPQLGKKYVGEHLHCFIIAEYKMPFLLVNVKVSIALIKNPTIPAKREGFVVKEIDLQSITTHQALVIPFNAVFEDCNYEFAD